jgi:phosphoserine aminotransferase
MTFERAHNFSAGPAALPTPVLEKAQQEIDSINRVIATVEKIELMAMLSRG